MFTLHYRAFYILGLCICIPLLILNLSLFLIIIEQETDAFRISIGQSAVDFILSMMCLCVLLLIFQIICGLINGDLRKGGAE